jgi:protoporphyrinogen oxidase
MARLGPTICDSFYFPYARKIWGLEPDEMAAEQAQRRVAANSPGKLVQKVLAQVPGSERRAPAASSIRARASARSSTPMRTRRGRPARNCGWAARPGRSGARIAGRCVDRGRGTGRRGRRAEGRLRVVDHAADAARGWRSPAPHRRCSTAAGSLDYRAMVLVYLELPVDRFTEYDAHYFPGADVAITRLSEPKNYSASSEPAGRTVLVRELPCAPDDAHWTASDEELGRLVARDLETAGVPLPAAPSAVHVRRLRHAYPIYTRGFAAPFHELDAWAARCRDC